MKNLEIITLCLYPSWQGVGEYICENYQTNVLVQVT
jgi:hypothetical protein